MNEEDTIQRCEHDAENPYLQVSRALIRDNSITPACRWLIIYLLANTEKWVIKIKQIVGHLEGLPGYGRDNVYELVEEAVIAGYLKREEKVVNNLKRYKYFISESPKFKKCFLYPESQDTGPQDTENQDALKKEQDPYGSKEEHLKGTATSPAPSLPSAPISQMLNPVAVDGSDLALEFKSRLKDDKLVTRALNLWNKHSEDLKRTATTSPTGLAASIVKAGKDLDPNIFRSSVKINQDMANRLKEAFPTENSIEVGSDCLIFSRGQQEALVLKFNDPEFAEKTAARIQQMDPKNRPVTKESLMKALKL